MQTFANVASSRIYKSQTQKLFSTLSVSAYPSSMFWIGLFLITIFGAIQGLARFEFSLTIDEPFTANAVHLPLAQMFELFQQETFMPLHYLLLKGWAYLFGESEVALRSLSLLFFCLTIFMVGLTAQQLSGRRSGLIAALLLAVSVNIGQVHAANARPYALLGFLVALTMLVCFHLIQLFSSPSKDLTQNSRLRDKRLLFFLLITVNVLGLMAHPIYIFVMCAYAFAAIFVSKRAFSLLVLCSAISLTIYLVVGGAALYNSSPATTTNWMKAPDVIDLFRGFVKLWGLVGSTLLLAYMVFIILSSFRQAVKFFISKFGLVSLSIISVTSLLPFFVSQFKPVFIDTRTPIIFLPTMCMFVATFISQLGKRMWTITILILLGAGSTISSVQAFTGPDPYPVRASVAYVLNRAECGDTLILGSLSTSEVEYYLRRFNAPICIQRATFPQSTQNHPGWIDIPTLLSQREKLAMEAKTTAAHLAKQNGSKIWLFHSKGSRYGYEVTNVLQSELDQQLTFVQTFELNGTFFDTVLLYSTDDQEKDMLAQQLK